MHRMFPRVFLVAALYVSHWASAMPDVIAAPTPPTDKPTPHIALILPLKSAAFGAAAEAVQQGFAAAAGVQAQDFPVRIYEADDENKEVLTLYKKALANGAQGVVGPLTRNGVAILAANASITVPTLALNVGEGKASGSLYLFGLPAEAEARQIAQLAAAAGLHDATIISNGEALSKRLSAAFADEWKHLGRNLLGEVLFVEDTAVLANVSNEAGSMVFLAADGAHARSIHPYLAPNLPVYATSQIFNGNTDTLTNYDLNEVRFVDMPWLLQADHPAVMAYPRASSALPAQRERLYALGIDAYRLIQILLRGTRQDLPLDGVTGRIQLNEYNQLQREALPAVLRGGHGQLPDALIELPVLFPKSVPVVVPPVGQ